MISSVRKMIARYVRDEAGQFAVMTAMFGLPLLLICGYAVDLNKAVGKKAVLAAALDAAALASVVPDNLDDEERADFARDLFEENYFGELPANLTVSATRERVDISATANMPTFMSEIAGLKTMAVHEEAAAILTRSDVVCVLALDPDGERAIEFSDKAQFNAPACSVQVNSTNSLALVSDVVIPPSAKSFCVGGLSRGEFDPYIKHACTPIDDPYANLTPPEDKRCIPKELINGYLEFAKSSSMFSNGAILIPATYCEGLTIDGVDIVFRPGTYVIKGGVFEISQGSQVSGDGVTFILTEGATLEFKDNAAATFKAPSKGDYAGIVFYQVPPTPTVGANPPYPSGTSNIKSGGGLSIVGTAYFPTQELIITSSSPVASTSPATSFIAYRLKFGDKSNTQVHVDHEAGGIPPMLPRSDEGARLVSTNTP